ncbi:MAG TPA: sugar phosphate isomerase/epimerase [Arenibaculum sp.]|nr:sugar phosphate isomerase/epimerase [Arenibaculum sp.]
MNAVSILSIQLYSLRGLGGLERQLEAVAAAGFRQVETIESQLLDTASTRDRLDALGLRASSSHVGMTALRERLDQVAGACAALGIEQVFMPALPAAERNGPAAAWNAAGRELGEIARRLADRGLALGYHTHDWELAVQDDGRTGLDHLFEGAAGSPLRWQVDVAWLARAGADPVPWLESHGGLVASAHVKDIAPAGRNADEDGWTDIGGGTLDWPDLWRRCRDAGARWMVAEHDNPKDPAGFASRSFAWLRHMPA